MALFALFGIGATAKLTNGVQGTFELTGTILSQGQHQPNFFHGGDDGNDNGANAIYNDSDEGGSTSGTVERAGYITPGPNADP